MEEQNKNQAINSVETRVVSFFTKTLNAYSSLEGEHERDKIKTELAQIKDLSKGNANKFARMVQEHYGHIFAVSAALNVENIDANSEKLRTIAGWVTFFGVTALLSIIMSILLYVVLMK